MTSKNNGLAVSKGLKRILEIFLAGGLLCVLAVVGLYLYIAPQLPNTDALRDVKFQLPLSVYSRDGKLIAQFGEKKRSPINIEDTPSQLIQAVLAAEDDRFFEHPGVDYQGLLRAAIALLRTGEKRQGGSTITMQVARNFFLSSEKTFLRKFKEIFLALKIEHALSKEAILELYLNKIYLGHRAYGIGAAAQVYYGKPISELNLAQQAMIAGLPKAPSTYNPLTNPDRAMARRNYVLRRMYEQKYIDREHYQLALNEPVTARLHRSAIELKAPHVAEMVRHAMHQRYGEEAYTSGYKVFTTVDSRLQAAANHALQRTLHEYDERHGYRGPEGQIDVKQAPAEWDAQLASIPPIGDTLPAVVVSVAEKSAKIYLGRSQTAELLWKKLKWARPYVSENRAGAAPKSAQEILQPGNIIRVRQIDEKEWALAQVPQAEGALISINPTDGGIVALVGGFDFFQSKYNRAVQAQRQPGSGFKPILYTTALEEGFTTASIINDAPVIYEDPYLAKAWRPENYSGKFYGPTRLRVALRKSRNLVSIRLLREVGIDKVIATAIRFGLKPRQLPYSLTLALGSGTATPLDMARVYAVFANGGFLIEPYFIERIESADGRVIEETMPKRVCSECDTALPPFPNQAPRVISPQIHYLMNSLLRDVISHGTAKGALQLKRSDLAGKTGTTNEQRDAWFNGFNPSLVAVSWVGFDDPKPLGHGETGAKAALPMWMYYMEQALRGIPERPLRQPEGLITARIDPDTGLLARPDDKRAVFEIFRTELAPKTFSPRYVSNPDGLKDAGPAPIQSLF